MLYYELVLELGRMKYDLKKMENRDLPTKQKVSAVCFSRYPKRKLLAKKNEKVKSNETNGRT